MAAHANVRAWDAGEGRFLHRGVAIATVDAVVPDVMFVAEGNRLFERHIDIGRVGRPKDRVSGPTGAADERDEPENDHACMDVGAAREDLGHESTLVSLARANPALQLSPNSHGDQVAVLVRNFVHRK